MKVGILSMQRVANYGSFLQAAGLKKIIENLGHEVIFIDYKANKSVVDISKKQYIVGKIKLIPIVMYLNDYLKYNILGNRLFPYEYRLFHLQKLGINPYKYNYNEAVDVAVIGSDEVFNCLQKGVNVGFAPMLFGEGINAKRVITYAASCGHATIDGIEKYKLRNTLKKYMRNLSAISVRDENTKEFVSSITGVEPSMNLDPVLMADYEIPEVSIPYSDYVILYTYSGRKYNEDEIKAIKDFCVRNRKQLISIGNVQPWIENKVSASPYELLAYIKKADFIITDTFHGSVFSIKYNKNFACKVRKDNKNKLQDLLVRLNKEDRMFTDFNNLQILYDRVPDYEKTNAIISNERKHTLEYLQQQLGSQNE